ncbi:MAG: hypothetical protein ACRERU_07720 [Methylococcales bacterium]
MESQFMAALGIWQQAETERHSAGQDGGWRKEAIPSSWLLKSGSPRNILY